MMSEKSLNKFLEQLEEVRKLVCEHNGRDCDHNRCMASINGCYGDECAFGVVEEAIDDLKRQRGN